MSVERYLNLVTLPSLNFLYPSRRGEREGRYLVRLYVKQERLENVFQGVRLVPVDSPLDDVDGRRTPFRHRSCDSVEKRRKTRKEVYPKEERRKSDRTRT